MRWQTLVSLVVLAVFGTAAGNHPGGVVQDAAAAGNHPGGVVQDAARPAAFETVFYMRNDDVAIRSFAQNAAHISIIGPQTFSASADGTVRGAVDPRILQIAQARGVKVMPLILNPGFDQATAHALLDDDAARARVVNRLVELAAEHGFWGWQFDFENIHASYRDRLTTFYREAADALHAAGRTISIAVVPTDGSPGDDPFSIYMQENWRNSFDVAALAESGDFVSWMTYAQHAGGTTPGPVAGLPWVRQMMERVLALGVAPGKISMGVPSYSDHWLPTFDEAGGARVRGRDISFARANDLAAAAGAEWIWLAQQGVHYTFFQRNVTFDWLFREDALSLARKLELFDAYPGLRGISVWVLGSEDPGIWDVIAARRRAAPAGAATRPPAPGSR